MTLEQSRDNLEAALNVDGFDWADLRLVVQDWWKELKAWEGRDTFELAYADNRMTARCINIGSSARGGFFEVRELEDAKALQKDNNAVLQSGDARMRLARDVAGIKERGKPENFFDPKTGKSLKNELGLHDLSASLLSGTKLISEQLKYYKDTFILFMPVPQEVDLFLFFCLNQLGKNELKDKDDNEIRLMRSQLTRIKLAQASDMGATFVYKKGNLPTDPVKFRYGHTGTVVKKGAKINPITKNPIGEPATEAELAQRRANGIYYKSILKDQFVKVNEVVMAYRSHGSPIFPMLATRVKDVDPQKTYYPVVDFDGNPTGSIIKNNGKFTAG